MGLFDSFMHTHMGLSHTRMGLSHMRIATVAAGQQQLHLIVYVYGIVPYAYGTVPYAYEFDSYSILVWERPIRALDYPICV